MVFDRPGEKGTVSEVLLKVYSSLKEKGYDPVDQLVGYLLSGDPTYVTGHNNARYLISTFERDELIEELVRTYIKQFTGERP
ncbi:MAG: IreB family regulatory phosphoprotein [Clostridia bacterium]|nr:IreB family regulatory phosphoprotein [Clostridia bacterium]